MKTTFFIFTTIVIAFFVFCVSPSRVFADTSTAWWKVQSIDTMKYSRDTAGEMLTKPEFDAIINQQVSEIAQTGATHIAIATPYDEMFIPFLKRWVKSARAHGLKVWFRGNFSGWEGWYSFPKITRDQHKELLKAFIPAHPDLFEDGDIFSACPECENGGPGDPRHTHDVAGHRQFLIDEYAIMRNEFLKIGKNVHANYNSMNGDVARLIMDPATTQSLGGIVVIDHYVPTTDQLISDVKDIAQQSGGKVVLGEFGVPLPDLHGKMTDSEQAQWIHDALEGLTKTPELIGLNYWTNVGGSTEIWSANGKPHLAVDTIHSFFAPKLYSGIVVDQSNQIIQNATIKTDSRETTTDGNGIFHLPHLSDETTLHITAPGYISADLTGISANQQILTVTLQSSNQSLFSRIKEFFLNLFWHHRDN